MLVAVVALFGRADDAVAASRRCAGVGTGIVVHLIAIVTGFVAFVLSTEILADHPIPTASSAAVVTTGVSVLSIAVIAGFAFLHELVTAGR